MNANKKTYSIDPLIHEAARLQLMVVLCECQVADFNFLLGVTKLTRGNLSSHLSKLIAAGYVQEKKEFIARIPHTEYRLTSAGNKAYKEYLEAFKKLTHQQS